MTHIAFLTTVLPGARRTGGELASQAVIDAIRAEGHDVTTVGYARHGAAARPGELAVGSRTIESERARRVEQGVWAATSLAMRLPLSAAKYASRAYRRAARDVLATAGAAIVDRPQAGWWIRDDERLPPFALLAQNVETGVYGDQAAAASGVEQAMLRREHRLVAALEHRLADRAAQVWTYTEEERAHFDGRLLPLPSAVGVPATPRRPTMDVAVLGTWSWEPNAVGLRWLLDDVVPRLGTRDVHVAGGGGAWSARPGVTYHGVVPDASAFLDAARVVVVPSKAGRGIQVKTIDALALGAWVVATPLALRGLDAAPPAVRVEDDGAAFAAAVGELLAAARDDRNEAALAWAAARRVAFASAVGSALDELLEHGDQPRRVRR